MNAQSIPAIVLGGSGYVAGELLRLLAAHPHFKLAGVLSDSQPGEPVAKAFPHLASCWPEERFQSQAQIESSDARAAASGSVLRRAARRRGRV